MRSFALTLLIMISPVSAMAQTATQTTAATSAHAFEFTSIEGEPLPLSQYAGQTVLVVNTASFCGFTKQYEGLQALYDRYRAQGLVVLGVPSNDFGAQEPGSAQEIQEFCEVNFSINFPMTAKTVVKGESAHPFYKWAGQELGFVAKPRWNFHKYLIGRDGKLVNWFSTMTKPNAPKVIEAIEAALAKGKAAAS